jgi:O-antigen ligase
VVRIRLAVAVPVLLYLSTALGGVWLSGDRPAAWERFGVIAAGVALYVAVACLSVRSRLGGSRAALAQRLLFGALPAIVAVYFLLTNDWSYRIGKLPWLDPALLGLAAWLPGISGYRLDSNTVGGVIAAFLPLELAALKAPKARDSMPSRAGVLLLSLSLLCLGLSESRGAWLAFAVAFAAWGLQAIRRHGWLRRWSSDPRWTRLVRVVVSLVAIGAAGVLLGTPLGRQLLGLRPDRLEVWRNSLDLAGDYAFTGLGLSGFELAYSSYVLLVHVPYLYHAHNLFLDLHLQQGLVGLAAFLWLILSAIWPGGQEDHWRSAGVTALTIILIHGCLDDPFYGYGGAATPLLLLPVAVLACPVERGEPATRKPRTGSRRGMWVAVLAGCLAVGLAITLPPLRSQLQANVGATLQTRTELAVYRWPEWAIQDAVRRSATVDLGPAIAAYEAALRSDSDNATANRRLGQIELSQGRYESARDHLLAAYRVAPGQRATRQMLGESYALAGDAETASRLWRTVDLSQDQLQLREWWYGLFLGRADLASRIAQARPGGH